MPVSIYYVFIYYIITFWLLSLKYRQRTRQNARSLDPHHQNVTDSFWKLLMNIGTCLFMPLCHWDIYFTAVSLVTEELSGKK